MPMNNGARKLFILIAAWALTTACASSRSQPDLSPGAEADLPAPSVSPPPMDTLVSTEWLSEHLEDPDLVVLDCTVRVESDEGGGFRIVSGRADFEGGY